MNCPKCKTYAGTTIFCPECGTKLWEKCPKCKRLIWIGNAYCGECGTKNPIYRG
ncbi:MAG: zinc ribbon domain-containing protein [Candidatus Bathyarchaeota archaeon]|nr:zinc ribbon domain-containing protein [Candidatus Bathyarchaeota archaeon]